jgi:hypothetical protein
MRIRILTTIGLGLALAGCQSPYGKGVPVAGQSASAICAGYGIGTDTATYTACVAYQEARAQSYPGESVPPYRLDQYNNRVDAQGYRVDSRGHRMAVQSPYVLPMGEISSGQTVLRDEYGNRYDARGNRI